MSRMEKLPHDPDAAPFAVGESVQLRRTLASARMGAAGRVIGFFRRDPETIAVQLASGVVIEVRPEDLEHRR
jgi:hypothetical protein